jgi:hypothetical protein
MVAGRRCSPIDRKEFTILGVSRRPPELPRRTRGNPPFTWADMYSAA